MDNKSLLRNSNILLLSGGWSAERDISIRSGSAVADALKRNDISFTHIDLKSKEEAQGLSEDYDLAFIALHGRGGEDGFIQEVLESKSIKYTGSDSKSCKVSLNKIEANFIQPSGEFYDFESKYSNSGTQYIKADLSKEKLEEIKDYAWHAFSTLGCKNWGRVDFIEDGEGHFQIIEVNTVPGLTETSLFPKAASYEGLSFDEVVLKVLQLSCK